MGGIPEKKIEQYVDEDVQQPTPEPKPAEEPKPEAEKAPEKTEVP
jgi:hypothetical protein